MMYVYYISDLHLWCVCRQSTTEHTEEQLQQVGHVLSEGNKTRYTFIHCISIKILEGHR